MTQKEDNEITFKKQSISRYAHLIDKAIRFLKIVINLPIFWPDWNQCKIGFLLQVE